MGCDRAVVPGGEGDPPVHDMSLRRVRTLTTRIRGAVHDRSRQSRSTHVGFAPSLPQRCQAGSAWLRRSGLSSPTPSGPHQRRPATGVLRNCTLNGKRWPHSGAAGHQARNSAGLVVCGRAQVPGRVDSDVGLSRPAAVGVAHTVIGQLDPRILVVRFSPLFGPRQRACGLSRSCRPPPRQGRSLPRYRRSRRAPDPRCRPRPSR